MKKKNLKLSLNKIKISTLKDTQARKIEGGGSYGGTCAVSICVECRSAQACWLSLPPFCRD